MAHSLIRWLLLAGGVACSIGAIAADPAALKHGQEVYGRCQACHSIEQNRTGPAHCGLFNRLAGTAPGFGAYSDALRRSRIVWTDATLERFLADPMAAVPGTNMTYLGVTDPAERRDLIAWLKEATRPGKACRPAG
jgi:cytochrome c